MKSADNSGIVTNIAGEHRDLPGALLPILHPVQEALGFISESTISIIAEELNLSRAEPCQAVGARALEAAARKQLGIDARLEQEGSIQWPCTEAAPDGTPVMHLEEFVRGKGLFVLTGYVPRATGPSAWQREHSEVDREQQRLARVQPVEADQDAAGTA